MNELLSFSYHPMKDHFLVWNVNEGTQILRSDRDLLTNIICSLLPKLWTFSRTLCKIVFASILTKAINGAWKSSLPFELSDKHFRKGPLSQRRSPQFDRMWGLGMLWQLGCHFHWYVSSSYGNRISVVKNDTCGFTALKATRNNSLPTCFSCIKRAGKTHLHDRSKTRESPWQDVREKKERKWSPSVVFDSLRPHGL